MQFQCWRCPAGQMIAGSYTSSMTTLHGALLLNAYAAQRRSTPASWLGGHCDHRRINASPTLSGCRGAPAASIRLAPFPRSRWTGREPPNTPGFLERRRPDQRLWRSRDFVWLLSLASKPAALARRRDAGQSRQPRVGNPDRARRATRRTRRQERTGQPRLAAHPRVRR